MAKRIGIDLGTTYCAVAHIDRDTGRAEIVANEYNESTTPSVLCFRPDGTVLYGRDAQEEQENGDANTVSLFKRFMGRSDYRAQYFGKAYDALDLSALLLERVWREAARQLGEDIEGAVITVPAYFTHPQRDATVRAAQRAGLTVLGIVNEPTAAVLAYGVHGRGGAQRVLIYDLGGGTFDVSVADIDDDHVRVLASLGNHDLGGANWDGCIYEYLADRFMAEYGDDPRADEGERIWLMRKAEQAKRQLTDRNEVTVAVDYLGNRAMIPLSRAKFAAICDHYMGITRDLCEQALSDAHLSWRQIDGVILVGGSTKMHMVQGYVAGMGARILGGVHPDEAVALGAALHANFDDKPRTRVTLAGEREPTRRLLGGKVLYDVIAHDLGMIAIDPSGERYINATLIARNAPVPSRVTRPFQLGGAHDGELEVYLLQDGAPRPLDNVILGKYVFSGIARGKPSVIDVTYAYSSDGMVQVEARQEGSDAPLSMRIEPVPSDMSWTDGPPPRTVAADVILAFDLSGSMEAREDGMTALERAKAAARGFIAGLPHGTRAGIIGFSDRSRVYCDPTDNRRKVDRALADMHSGATGYANAGHPFDDARRSFGNARPAALLVLTDGVWSNTSASVRAAKTCHDDGIDVYALGFGDADRDFLRRIASNPDLVEMTEIKLLSGSMGKIAQAMALGLR